jgi:hypothetical protein
VSLSEHEQKILDEIERHLAEEDPRFVQRAHRVGQRRSSSRQLVLAGVGFAFGLVLLLGLTFSIFLGLAGVAVMFAAVVTGANAWRQRLSDIQASSAENSDRSSP